jgi:hypothetical protein
MRLRKLLSITLCSVEGPGRGCSTLGHDKLSRAICHSVNWQGVLPGPVPET